MNGRKSMLLLLDGTVNLLLGVFLLFSPVDLADALGVPLHRNSFYPTLLGGVLLGIGLALFIQRYGEPRGITGLGIAGAIAINLCGGGAFLFWLILGDLRIPTRGQAALWTVAVVVLLIGIVEAASGVWREQDRDA